MATFYKVLYILGISLGSILIFLTLFFFFKLKVCLVAKELKNTKQEDDIKKLLKNTVLLNPQIQEDLPNIEGYNDLLAYYFKVLKAEEKKKEQMNRQINEKCMKVELKIPHYNDILIKNIDMARRKKRYSVECLGMIDTINIY